MEDAPLGGVPTTTPTLDALIAAVDADESYEPTAPEVLMSLQELEPELVGVARQLTTGLGIQAWLLGFFDAPSGGEEIPADEPAE